MMTKFQMFVLLFYVMYVFICLFSCFYVNFRTLEILSLEYGVWMVIAQINY